MLLLELDTAKDTCLYVSANGAESPVGRISIAAIRGNRVLLAIDGDEDEFRVQRHRALQKKLGMDGMKRLIQRFETRRPRAAARKPAEAGLRSGLPVGSR